jgi:two-component system, NarL family, sensor kinase
MLGMVRNIIIFLVFFTLNELAFAEGSTFTIEDLATAKKIESEINKYPSHIKFNLLLKLANYYYNSEPEKTIFFTEQATNEIKASESNKYNNLLLASELLKGKAYSKQGLEFEAGQSFLKMVILTPPSASQILKFNGLSNLSESLLKQSNYVTSLKYAREALKISESLNNTKLRIRTLMNMADAFIFLNETDSAKLLLATILNISEDTVTQINTHINYSKIYLIEDDFLNADNHLSIALDLAERINSRPLISECYFKYAQLFSSIKDYKTADEYLEKSKTNTILKNHGIDYLLSAGLILEQNNKYEEASRIYKYASLSIDSLLSIQQHLSNQNFSSLLKILEKENEIKTLKHNNNQIEANVKKTRFLIIISLTLILFLIIAIYLIFQFQSEKNKNIQTIASQKEELTLKKHKEDIRKMELKTAIAQIQGQEIERERLAKELHDGVGGTLAGLKMELESFFSTMSKKNEMNYFLKALHNTYLEVRSISKNLSLPNFSNASLESNIKELINNFPGKNDLTINFNAFPQNHWDDIDINTQKEIYRIIQEAITNVIKHAKATELDIQIVNDYKSLVLIIEDNGIGFDMTKTWPGIGLKNIYSRASVLKGELSIESSPGESTTINLKVPLEQ